MSKTSEKLAQQYISTIADTPSVKAACEKAFLAGYQAAKESNSPENPGGCNSSNNLNGWISVKDRLPEIPENDYSNRVLLLRADGFIVIARVEKCVRFVRPLQEALIVETDNGDPIEEFTHWMPLPSVEGLKHED